MNRRGFLLFSAAAAAIAAVPAVALAVPKPDVLTWDMIDRARDAMLPMSGHDAYCIFMHPSQFEDLRHAEARSRWRAAYHAWRKDGRPGMAAPEVIFERYDSGPEWMPTGELGTWRGVKFKVSSGPSIRAALPCASR